MKKTMNELQLSQLTSMLDYLSELSYKFSSDEDAFYAGCNYAYNNVISILNEILSDNEK